MTSFKRKLFGFSLLELMIVVAIIAFLSMVAVPNFMRYLARAKRTEAYINLGAIYTAQKMYWAEHGSYTSKLSGLNGAGWRPEGYHGGGAQEKFYYSYGFAHGNEGEHHFTGKSCCRTNDLQKSFAKENEFLVIAAADIAGSGKPDIIGINEKHEIIVFQDGLVD
jgi:prepilin-type N-terminal cleavage/methylation domain-containing protein